MFMNTIILISVDFLKFFALGQRCEITNFLLPLLYLLKALGISNGKT